MPNFVQPSFFRRVFLQHFGLKLVSLLLAIGLWFAVARDPVAEVEVRVPIEFQHFPENLEIDSANTSEAQIRVRGPERLIHRLQASDVRAEIDLALVHPGEQTFDLNGGQVHVPQDLEVVQVSPRTFHVSFDNRASRSVEVRPRVTGNFASGRQVAEVIADPPNVMISGPRRRVDAVEAATTDPVDATGALSRATFVTRAYVPDPLIQVVHPTPIRVTVIMESSENEKK
jgi:YbbR domain-containing protein